MAFPSETFTHERSIAWQQEMAEAANRADSLASRITYHAGGGSPAHKLREAAKLLDEARRELQDLTPSD